MLLSILNFSALGQTNTAATVEDIEKKIAVKIKSLALAVKENERILSRDKENELMKQQEFIKKRLGVINDLKNQGQEIMLENDKVSFEEVEEWGSKYRDVVVRYNIPMDDIKSKLRSFKEMEKQNATRMEQMMMEMQLHMKKKEEYDAIKLDRNTLNVNLSRLRITMFNGTYIYWFRFWDQFESEIDRSTVSIFFTLRY